MHVCDRSSTISSQWFQWFRDINESFYIFLYLNEKGKKKTQNDSMIKVYTGEMLTREIFKSRLNLIVRVNVVLNRTVVVDSDWRFDNLCGSHLQSQSELYLVS